MNLRPEDSLAAVDLGSNSFHMVVARVGNGQPVIVDRLREMVQLAAGLDAKRRLKDKAQEVALECLERFGQRLRSLPSDHVRAVGTNTLRRARNAQEFVERAEAALGHPVETISGREEARLIYLGVAHSSPRVDGRRLVVDIGGGSTEIIVGEGFVPVRMESLYVGCVSMSRRFFADGAIDAKRWRKAELATLQELDPIREYFRAQGWQAASGASGTIRAVAAVLAGRGWSQGGVTAKGLRKLREALIKAGHVDGLSLDGVGERRRPVFTGGVAVLGAVFEALGIDSLQPSDGALREGLLYDLLGRRSEEDVRRRSVEVLAERYHVDRAQAARVRETALGLLDQVAADWRLSSPAAQRLLAWAAELHEIGLDIAHASYHKHGAYIIGAADLFGFSRDEQAMLATLVRAHRRKFPVAELAMPRPKVQRRAERLAIVLRLGAILRRSRSPEPQAVPRLRVNKRELSLEFGPGWLDEHPLTRADLEQEARWLEAAGYRLRFT